MTHNTGPAPQTPRNGLYVRLQRFWRVVAIRFRSRVSVAMRGSES